MKFNNYNSEEVFQEFLKIAERDGILKEKASYTLPDELIFTDNKSEAIDTSAEMAKIAAEGREKLYDLGAEDLLGKAHPEGSKPLSGVDGGELSVIEDLPGLKKKLLELVNKNAKVANLSSRVVKIAAQLDEGGFTSLATRLDKVAENLMDFTEEEADKLYDEYLEEQGDSSMEFSPEEVDKLYAEYEKERAAGQGRNTEMMLEVQKRINKHLSELGYDPVKYEVPENGNMADSETLERIRDVFKLVPGQDYTNWQELLSKLDESARQMANSKMSPAEKAFHQVDESGHGHVFDPKQSPLDDLDLEHLNKK